MGQAIADHFNNLGLCSDYRIGSLGLRAWLMFSLIIIGKSMKRQSHTFNTLAASAFLLLIFNPGMLYDLGFQLSYGAVFGIVTFQPYIKQMFVTTSKAKEYLWGMINVSLAAQLFVTPFSVFYFHQFPNYFLLANLIAIPLSVDLYGRYFCFSFVYSVSG